TIIFFSSRRRHTTSYGDWSSDVCSSDLKGKLLKTVKTESKNTSGMGIGGGFIWMGANAAPNGIFQTDMKSKTIAHRQIPLGGGEIGRASCRERGGLTGGGGVL